MNQDKATLHEDVYIPNREIKDRDDRTGCYQYFVQVFYNSIYPGNFVCERNCCTLFSNSFFLCHQVAGKMEPALKVFACMDQASVQQKVTVILVFFFVHEQKNKQ
jgi:hypothetical protein